MHYYTGLDISMKETAICIMDESGKVTKEGTVPTEPSDIAKYLNETGLDITKVALESGCLSHWLVQELWKLSIPAICIDARHIAAVLATTINKTDKNDARGIANALRCNIYREVHPKSTNSVDISTILASRRTLVDQRTTLTNTLRGLLKAYGIRIPHAATTHLFFEAVRGKIAALAELVKFSLEELLKLAEGLHKQVKMFDKLIEKLAAEDEAVKRLRTIPGVGPITAMNYKMEIDDPKRFHNSRAVGAYFGMTPTQYSSGETQKQGRISKCGSREMRYLLREAAFVLITRSTKWSTLKAWGMKLMKKIGLEKACVAVGRKLAIIMHRMLITGEEFKYGEPRKPVKDKALSVSEEPSLALEASA